MIVAKETHPDMRWKPSKEGEIQPVTDYLVLLNFRYDRDKVGVLRRWPGSVWHVERKVWMIPESVGAIALFASWKEAK